MARSDYAHHNEEQDAMWWMEEGRWEPAEDPAPDAADYWEEPDEWEEDDEE